MANESSATLASVPSGHLDQSWYISISLSVMLLDECVMELLTEITFYLKDLSIWQGKYLITKHLLL